MPENGSPHRASHRRAVVVVNYGSSALLERNLAASTAPGTIVVVVDSFSGDEERARVLELAGRHGWLVETPAVNTGFGGGCNLGVARAIDAGATSLFLLNPDARIAPDDLDRLFEQVETDASLLLAPRIVTTDGSPWMSTIMDLALADGSVGSSRHRTPGQEVMEWVSGAAMTLSAELWSRIGGFDDDYFLYWEDIDLCRRVHGVGGTVRVDESVVAVHDEGGTHSEGGRAKSETYYVYNIRGRALYAAKWLSPSDRRRWARQTPRTALDVLLKGGRRQFVQGVAPWRAYLRGVAAAKRVESRRTRTGTIRVLESFVEPTAATNPYITQLLTALRATPGLSARPWRWRTALLGRYDVLHTHWPEALIERRGTVSTLARRALFALLLVRLGAARRPIVRTVHNVERPSDLSRVESLLLDGVDRLTAAKIVLNEFTPTAPGEEVVLVEHGHYRDWFARYPASPTVPGRLAFTGKVRRYKNVVGLAEAFTALGSDEPWSLRIAGKPSSAELVRELTAFAERDARISLDLSFLDDADLVTELGESELVVLPYHEMHNSGSVLAALSVDRPVLVPDTEFNRALAAEVGDGWVLGFEGELTAATIESALRTVRGSSRSPRPDLSRRDWSRTGERHREAFRRAMARRARGSAR